MEEPKNEQGAVAVGIGELTGTNTTWSGFEGDVNALEAQRAAADVIHKWENEEFYESDRNRLIALLEKKKRENSPVINQIWNQLITPENKKVWRPIVIAIFKKYGQGKSEEIWKGWNQQQKVNFLYYIFVTGSCNDINSDDCELLITHINDQRQGGGFFFNKKKTRKRRKKKTRKKKNKKKKTVKKKDRKWTDNSYPYRSISNQEAIDDFLSLKRMAKGDINPSSLAGNKTVDWGTERARRKTKYRNHSFIEMWNRKDRRKKMMEFARRIHKKDPRRAIEGAIRSAIDLQWGTVNTMRAAAAVQMYKKYKATRVLDFTAGWGARMIAAMALDIDYIGIDTNTDLKPGYAKIIKLLKPYTKSKVKMVWKEAQKVNYSKLGKYDYVFTSPPYEYLEAYENMTNYEKKGSKIVQPSSSQKIKMDDSAKFYEEFLVPTLKKAYKYLPRNKFICLNMPDIMYDKIKGRWKKVTKCEDYKIIKRTGGPVGKNRRGKELIYCWKKR